MIRLVIPRGPLLCEQEICCSGINESTCQLCECMNVCVEREGERLHLGWIYGTEWQTSASYYQHHGDFNCASNSVAKKA